MIETFYFPDAEALIFLGFIGRFCLDQEFSIPPSVAPDYHPRRSRGSRCQALSPLQARDDFLPSCSFRLSLCSVCLLLSTIIPFGPLHLFSAFSGKMRWMKTEYPPLSNLSLLFSPRSPFGIETPFIFFFCRSQHRRDFAALQIPCPLAPLSLPPLVVSPRLSSLVFQNWDVQQILRFPFLKFCLKLLCSLLLPPVAFPINLPIPGRDRLHDDSLLFRLSCMLSKLDSEEVRGLIPHSPLI